MISKNWYLENHIDPSKSVGIDEVGRGPLAGPVVAAAVWIPSNAISDLNQENFVIRDSKKMTASNRQKVVNYINNQQQIRYAIGMASVEEIDELNILQATFLAMQRAVKILNIDVPTLLIDGNRAPTFSNKKIFTIVGGDDRVLSISLASIIAKQYRDKVMTDLAREYPQYEWDKNVGYGTRKHIDAIHTYGITPFHRKTFAPMKNMIKQ